MTRRLLPISMAIAALVVEGVGCGNGSSAKRPNSKRTESGTGRTEYNKVSRETVTIEELIERSSNVIIPDLERKHPGKIYTIEWNTDSLGKTRRIELRQFSGAKKIIVAGDYLGLKRAIGELARGSMVAYIFADARMDLLSDDQIIELYNLCESRSIKFHLFKGG